MNYAQAIIIAATVWDTPETKGLEMNVHVLEAFARILVKETEGKQRLSDQDREIPADAEIKLLSPDGTKSDDSKE